MRREKGKMKQNSFWKKICAIAMASTLVLSMAACGGKKDAGEQGAGGASSAATSEYTYTAEYSSFKFSSEADLNSAQIADGKMYYLMHDYSGETEKTEIRICSIADGKEAGGFPLDLVSGEDSSRYVSRIAVRPDGNIAVLECESKYSEDTTTNLFTLRLYDAAGQQVAETNVMDAINESPEYFYMNNMACDGENRLYLFSDSGIYLFGADLKYAGTADMGSAWIVASGRAKDGKVYASSYEQNGSGMQVQAVEFDQKKLGEPHAGFKGGYGQNFQVGATADLLCYSSQEVYEYDLKSNTATSLFAWLDCDIMGESVRCVCAMDDGRYAAVIGDSDTGESSLAYFTKVKRSEVPQKKQVTVATLFSDYELTSAAVAFNKQSKDYHINIKSFMDEYSYSEEAITDGISRMNNELTSGSNIDVVSAWGVNIETLSAKGVFVDLSTCLDKSSSLNKSDYLENVLEAGTYNGTLVYIPKTFNVQTLVTKAKNVNGKTGWTMKDLLAFAKANPDAIVYNYASKDSALDMCLAFAGTGFIDYSTGKCDFESDEFKSILEFVGSFPDEYDWSQSEDYDEREMVQSGKLLLERANMYYLGSLQVYPELFGEDVTFIGYPTADGSTGHLLTPNGLNLAICSKSSEQDGAWAFIEYYLNSKSDFDSESFSSKKADLEKQVQEKMKPQYLEDEHGQPYKDENGQPILNTPSVWYGDWQYEYHVSTQEEMDQEMAIINQARASHGVDEQILTIIKEEAAAYFAGQKDVNSVASVIQSRVQLYINENR